MTSHELVQIAKKQCLQLVHNAKASHLGGAFSIADVLSVLYTGILSFDPTEHKWQNRDRLFYSKGHASTILYAILCSVGFFDEEVLQSFSKDGSILTTHVNHKVPGVELSTGSLGHALSVACGVALAGKHKKADWHVYAILSDGELDEGSNWEAILFAPHHKLDNLTLIIDYNKIQSLGFVTDVLDLEPLVKKFESFGWYVIEIDGHDHIEIGKALQKQNAAAMSKPKVVIAHTVKGKGIDFMEHNLAWHYKSPDAEQLKVALAQIESI